MASSAERMSHSPSFKALVISPLLTIMQSVTLQSSARSITPEQLVKDACWDYFKNTVITSNSFPVALLLEAMNFRSYLCWG